MACSPIHIHSELPDDSNRVDHFSNFPDELIVSIISLLWTREAARTSVLARRFRHLWKSSLSVDTFTPKPDTCLAMADCALLQRNPGKPLLNLRLSVYGLIKLDQSLRISLTSSLLIKAHHLGVRHLTIKGHPELDLEPILPIIFSISSLESLYFKIYRLSEEYSFPSAIMLTRLKSLNLITYVIDVNSTKLNRIISELCCLEDLYLQMTNINVVSISSQTIRKLKLRIDGSIISDVVLSIPSMELLHFETFGVYFKSLPSIQEKIPLRMRNAVISLNGVSVKDVTGIPEILKYISNAEVLTLEIMESKTAMYPFPMLLKPGKVAPNFSRLKHLEVTACFHDFNLEVVVTLLHHSPALESVRLVHKTTASCSFGGAKRIEKDWASKLPRNTDGNHCHAYFTNLHLGKNREELMKLLKEMCS